jgi:hypothetical protein
MAGILLLQHTYDLSDEEVVKRWSENPASRNKASTMPSFSYILVMKASILLRFIQKLFITDTQPEYERVISKLPI